jgi:hypothetical protein
MKRITTLALMLALTACKTPTQRWLDGLEDQVRAGDQALTLEARRIPPRDGDTSTVTYRVRLYPAKDWLGTRGAAGTNELNYHTDSCFLLRQGKHDFAPALFEPVSNGRPGCFEYLLSFDLDRAMQAGRLQLVYRDRFISGKPYSLILHAQ